MSWDKLQRLDVRWIYVIILLCLIIPMFKPIGLPIANQKTLVKCLKYRSLPNNSVILVSHDLGSGNART